MNILTKITDLLFRKQRQLELVAIFLFFCLVAFSFDKGNVKLVWRNYPFVALVLALVTALVAIVWLRIEKQRTNLLIADLQNKGNEKSAKIESQLTKLSSRQREVFDLILKGKSNKEIISELHIELSTLKTHINQVYKILGIQSRRETKSFVNESTSVK